VLTLSVAVGGGAGLSVNTVLAAPGRSPGSSVSSALPSPTPSYTGAIAI
jgi:hypothetical protein